LSFAKYVKGTFAPQLKCMKKNLYTLFLLFLGQVLFAGNFTPGNLVVVRVGDGSVTLSNASTAVFLDEYTTSGTLVQSIAVPTSVNGSSHALTLSGKATTEGALTLSPNNEYLSFVGFDTTTGYANVSTGITNRTVARVGSNGVVNTTTGFYAGSAYVADNFRGAVTLDGTSFWCAGAGSGTSGGTWNIPFGSFTNTATQINSAISSVRYVNIFGGQLYFTTNSSTTPIPGLFSLGSGIPTTSGQAATMLTDASGDDSVPSPYAFYFCHQGSGTGNNVMYICDDETASPAGGIYKFSLVNGIWISNGNIPNVNGIRGLAAYTTCSGVNMYVTAGNGVFTFADNSGYNQTITGTFNQIVTAGTNTVIRGIAFAPGTVPPGPLNASLTPENITCNGAANGSISSTVSGGTIPYSYNWGGGITSPNRTGLATGNYTVTVSDAGGCSATATASISQPATLSATPTATAVGCFGGSTGSINLAVTGGTTAYSYNWSNGATTQNLANLILGSYSVTVTDSHSCSTTATASVTQPTEITIVATVTNLPCTGGAGTGAVNIAVSGGTGAHTYVWSNTSTTQNISGLNTGTFTVTVTDANHCTASQSANVSQAGSLTLSVVKENVLCFGQSNGGIVVTASGGTPAYNYAWSTGNNNQPQTGLSAGNYTVTVTDQAGCTLINSIEVTQPAVLTGGISTTNEGCYGDANGAANLSVSGGTTPYAFHWSNSATTQNLMNLAASNYSVTVTDSNACSVTVSGMVTQPDSITVIGTVTNATSFGASDGQIALTVTGGTSGYTYSWNSGSGSDNTSLMAGNYCVTVSDAHNCTASDCFVVSQPNGISETPLTLKFVVYGSGDNLIIKAELNEFQQCAIQLRDVAGRLIYSSESMATSQVQLQISTSSISSGCYILSLVGEQGTASKKVVITR